MILIVVWLVCSVYSTGTMVAYFQESSPTIAVKNYRQDLGFCVCMALLFGPIAAVISTFFSGFLEHGWYIRRRRYEVSARWHR